MNLTCYIISKLEFSEYTHHFMPLVEMWIHLYEYMRALASQELNPMIIPPDILKRILHRIMEDIKSNARLRL